MIIDYCEKLIFDVELNISNSHSFETTLLTKVFCFQYVCKYAFNTSIVTRTIIKKKNNKEIMEVRDVSIMDCKHRYNRVLNGACSVTAR